MMTLEEEEGEEEVAALLHNYLNMVEVRRHWVIFKETFQTFQPISVWLIFLIILQYKTPLYSILFDSLHDLAIL